MNLLRRYRKFVLVVPVVAGLFAYAALSFSYDGTSQAADARQFNAGNIISDYVMTNKNSMSEAQIQNFLKSKNHCNDRDYGKYINYSNQGYQYTWRDGHFVCMADDSFGGESAAHIIWQAAQDYGINPQALIVLLEKEQRLVTDTWPNQIQYRGATGYGCPDTAPCDSEYYGLKNQVRNAARFFRAYQDNNPGWYKPYWTGTNTIKWHPNSGCGTSQVNIESRATASLYSYTPYRPNQAALNAQYGTGDGCSSYGNRNFYLYFTDWFRSTSFTIPESNIYIPNGIYVLTNPQSGRALDVREGGTANHTPVQIYDNNNTDAQKWLLTRTGDNFYTLKNVGSGRYLDVDGAGTANQTRVKIYDQNSNSCAQKWAVRLNGDNTYNLLSACSGKALDIAGGGTANGTLTQIFDRNDTAAQRWSLKPTDAGIVANGTYTLQLSSGKVLDVDSAGTADGTKVKIWNDTGSTAQKWVVTRGSDGLYTVKTALANKVLDVAGGGTANGAKLQIWTPNNTCAQKWNIVKKDDSFILLSSCSNKALDVIAGSINTAGTLTQIFDRNDTAAQRWKFVAL
jgi:hypothetical protein